MSARVKWVCPGCQTTYAVPTVAGLRLCPKCQRKLQESDEVPVTRRRQKFRLTSNMVLFGMWMLLNLATVAIVFFLFYDLGSGTDRVQQEQAARGQIPQSSREIEIVTAGGLLCFVSAFYVIGLCFLALVKFLLPASSSDDGD